MWKKNEIIDVHDSVTSKAFNVSHMLSKLDSHVIDYNFNRIYLKLYRNALVSEHTFLFLKRTWKYEVPGKCNKQSITLRCVRVKSPEDIIKYNLFGSPVSII